MYLLSTCSDIKSEISNNKITPCQMHRLPKLEFKVDKNKPYTPSKKPHVFKVVVHSLSHCTA